MQAKAQATVLPGRHSDVELVTRVSRRIIAALPQAGSVRGYVGHLARCQWEFAVVHSPTVNAVVVPGGKVIVYTGAARRTPPPPTPEPRSAVHTHIRSVGSEAWDGCMHAPA